MNANDLLLRCYAEQERDGVWVAVCIDLCLATQGESYDEVRRQLQEQIEGYLYDALVGDDRDYAHQLLTRKAPLRLRLRYHLIHIHWLRRLFRHQVRDFIEQMRLIPLRTHAPT